MPKPVEYVAKSGRRTWRVRTRDTTGRQTSETFATKAEAERFCRTVEGLGGGRAIQHRAAHLEDDNIPTLDVLAARHIDARSGTTEGTRSTYRRLYARTWQLLIGQIRVDLLTREHVSRGVNVLAQRYSDKSVANAHGFLSAVLAGAVADGLIERSPAKGTRLPRTIRHDSESRFLTPTEFAAVVEHLPERHRLPLLMLGGTGMRWGELEALTVADVNPGAATVRITKAVKYGIGSERAVGPPKTERSRRTVTLPSTLVSELRPLLLRPRTAPLFVSTDGSPVRHHAVYRAWKRACAAAGIEPAPGLHAVRHSHASWLIAAGVPLPVIQARLGHSSISITVDVYGHLTPDLQAAAVRAAEAALGSAALPSA